MPNKFVLTSRYWCLIFLHLPTVKNHHAEIGSRVHTLYNIYTYPAISYFDSVLKIDKSAFHYDIVGRYMRMDQITIFKVYLCRNGMLRNCCLTRTYVFRLKEVFYSQWKMSFQYNFSRIQSFFFE